MGLDMYLTKRKYIGGRWDKQVKRGIVEIKYINGNGEEEKIDNLENIDEIIFNVGYWRKSNQIHKWFVDNVQDGDDDCKEYWLSSERLQELLDIVNRILENSELIDGEIFVGKKYENGESKDIIKNGKVIKDASLAIELLPTEGGFFFGNTDYDEYYVDDLKSTKEILEKALADASGYDFYYRASW